MDKAASVHQLGNRTGI